VQVHDLLALFNVPEVIVCIRPYGEVSVFLSLQHTHLLHKCKHATKIMSATVSIDCFFASIVLKMFGSRQRLPRGKDKQVRFLIF
jgi:hypothetical protein